MNGLGVYVDIPFCVTRCDYCAFATSTVRGHLMDALWMPALPTYVGGPRRGELVEADTVYFGGGTPSRVRPPN